MTDTLSTERTREIAGREESSGRVWTPSEAYAWCERLARSHYENFPVASRLMPRESRRHIAAVYAFARTADDLADEGTRPAEERLEGLEEWSRKLALAAEGVGEGPIFTALARTIRDTGIPVSLLEDLLIAFRRDALNRGFEMERDLFEYCRYSANPVGRLVLHLFGCADPERVALSDHICTGLQLANFWQDVSVDLDRGRVNIPREAMRRFAYTERELNDRVENDNFRALISYLTDMAENSIGAGSLLPRNVPTLRLQLELSFTVMGGLRITEKIREMDYNVLSGRPRLDKSDLVRIVWRLMTAWR